jgi:uncharacterized SAM-binding protein YcdF (DUF218 family)
MIRKLIVFIVVIAAAIFGLCWYFNLDDLSACGKTPSSAPNCQVVDAIVAISGGDTMGRTQQAIDLYKAGWSNVLIFSGDAEDKNSPSNAYEMQQLALRSGVPKSAIYIDEKASSTKQNAQNCQVIFNQLGVKKIILVTSGYHQRRASLEFKKYTSGVTILNHSTSTDKDWSTWSWWISMRGWWLAGSEIGKTVVFYVAGA